MRKCLALLLGMYLIVNILTACHSTGGQRWYPKGSPQELITEDESFQEPLMEHESSQAPLAEEEPLPGLLKVTESCSARNQEGDPIQSQYFIATHNYSEMGVSIDYPQIEGFRDKEVQDHVNEKIRAMFLSNFLNNWVWDGLSVNANYEIMLQNDQYLSLLSVSEPCVYKATPTIPSKFLFGLTIDLTTGNFVGINDLMTLGQFRESIRTENYQIEPSWVEEDYSLSYLSQMPQFNSVVHSDDFEYCSFYLTETALCYLIEISGGITTIVFPY